MRPDGRSSKALCAQELIILSAYNALQLRHGARYRQQHTRTLQAVRLTAALLPPKSARGLQENKVQLRSPSLSTYYVIAPSSVVAPPLKRLGFVRRLLRPTTRGRPNFFVIARLTRQTVPSPTPGRRAEQQVTFEFAPER